MGKINFGRVLLGGLAAGILMTIGEYLLNEMVLGSQMKDYFAMHKFPTPGSRFMVIAIAATVVLGIAIVLLYAMIRPRFGPSPNAAIIAALTAWLLVFLYNNVIGVSLGLVTVNHMAFHVVRYVVLYLITVLV